jgi:hypothetical protein
MKSSRFHIDKCAEFKRGGPPEFTPQSIRLCLHPLWVPWFSVREASICRLLSCCRSRNAYPCRRSDADARFMDKTHAPRCALFAALHESGIVQVFDCAGFRTPAMTASQHTPAAGVRKAPRHEIASGGSAAAVPQARGGAAGTMGIWRYGWAGSCQGRDERCGRFALR